MKKYLILILFMFALITLTSSICYSTETGAISGKVVDSKTGKGLKKINITISGNTYSTDEQGEFFAKDLLPGEYYVQAKGGGYVVKTQTVKCVAGKTATVNFKMQVTPVISGSVTDKNTKNPIKDARIILESSNNADRGIITDENGKFKFSRIKGGVYTIKAVADGYTTKYLPDIIYEPSEEKKYDMALEPIPEIITQTFPVKYFPVQELANRVMAVVSVKGRVIVGTNSLIVKDTNEVIKNIQIIIDELDVPPKQIQLEVKLLLASSDKEKKTSMPKELDSIAKQLKTLFRYKNYELLDDAQYVALENTNGSFLIGKGEYRASIQRIDFLEVNGALIKLERFQLISKIEKDYLSIFNTTVNIPNGDTVILGASNVDASGKALIIAVTAKTMEQ